MARVLLSETANATDAGAAGALLVQTDTLAPIVVATYAPGLSIGGTAVTANPDGSFDVFWQSHSVTIDDHGLPQFGPVTEFEQVYSASGARVGPVATVAGPTSNITFLEAEGTASGGYVLLSETANATDAGAAGALLVQTDTLAPIVVATYAPGLSIGGTAVTANPDGSFDVFWQSHSVTIDDHGLPQFGPVTEFEQVYSASGARVGPVATVAGPTSNITFMEAEGTASGGYVLLSETANATDAGAAGALLVQTDTLAPIVVATYAPGLSIGGTAVTANPDGSFDVFWQSHSVTIDDHGLPQFGPVTEFEQVYSASGARVGPVATVAGPTSNITYLDAEGTNTALFTSSADVVNFNAPTSDQQSAIAGGADLYNGLGGNDVVTLPNVANYNESVGNGKTLGWNASQTFGTGSLAGQTYTVNGGDGNYNIALGAGNDTVTINGNGGSNIALGAGKDAVSISGTGNNTISAGSGTSGVSIVHFDGQLTGTTSDAFGGNLLDVASYAGGTSGTATIGGSSTLELETAFAGAIAFSSSPGGTLKIDGSDPTGVVSNFNAGDTIDFTARKVNSLSGYSLIDSAGQLALGATTVSDKLSLSGHSAPQDYIISADKSGGAKFTAEAPSEEGEDAANLVLDLFSTLIKSTTALKAYQGGLTVENFEHQVSPVFTTLGTLADANGIYQQFQTSLEKAGSNEAAIEAAWDNAMAAVGGYVVKTGVKEVLVKAGAAIAGEAGATAVLGFAVDGALGEFLVGLAIAADVVAAPIIIGAAAAFVAGVAFDVYYDKYLKKSVDDWVQEHFFNSKVPEPTVLINTTSNVDSGQSTTNVLVASAATLNIQSGASASGVVLNNGGIENVYGSDTGAIIGDGGLQTVYGAATNVVALDPGVQVVAVGGAATGTKLYGGEQDVYGTATGTIVNAGGLAIVYAGGTLTNAAIDGGSVELKPGARVSAGLAFSGPGGVLQIDDFVSAPDLNGVVSGFAAGDIIRLQGFGNYSTVDGITTAYDATTNTTTFTLTDGGSSVGALELVGNYGPTNMMLYNDLSVPGAVDIAINVAVAAPLPQVIHPNNLQGVVHPNNLSFSGSVTGPHNFIDMRNFIASYGDLINAFGTNQQAAQNWYNTSEPIEQRVETFDGLDYVASYGDLVNAFKSAGSKQAVLDAGATHFIDAGFHEGRTTTFNGLDYIASYGDLINAFGANGDAGAYHYIESGASEGRTTTFDGLDYIASYGDLINAFGANEQAGAAHFIDNGSKEGRTTTFNGLDYIASYGDLIHAFGDNNDAGASHYIQAGHNEGRTTTFDGLDYIASYSDLIKALGANEQAGAEHFIDNGSKEGRTTTFNGLAYIANNTDLMTAFGADNDAGATHYIDFGSSEHRSASFNVGAYESAHPDLIGKFSSNDAFLTAYINTYKASGTFLT